MMANKLWYFLFVAILLTSCNSDDEAVLVGNWKKLSSFGGNERAGASSFVIGDYAYVGLGYNLKSTNTRYRDFWRYDATTDSWRQVADLHSTAKARSGAASFAIEGKGYITSGITEESKQISYLDDTWEFIPPNADLTVVDPTKNIWVKKANFKGAPRRGAISIALGTKGYVGSGKSEDNSQLQDFYEYNPATDVWTDKTPIKGSKRQGALTFVVNNTIYVCCGNDNGTQLTDLYAYDVAADNWIRKADMRNATDEGFDDKYTTLYRTSGVAFVLDGKAYIALGSGGTLGSHSGQVSSTWEYEPITDRWVEKTSFEGPGRYDAVSFVVKNRAFIATGDRSGSVSDDVWEFQPNVEVNKNDNQL